MMLSENPSVYKSFLACPISGFVRFGRLELPQQFERFIRAIFTVLMEESDETFLALARERWGASIMQGDICTPLDFEEMRRCDLVVAYPGSSCGVAIELGWASALGKPIILLLDPIGDYTPMIRGLGMLPGSHVETVPVEMVEGFPFLGDPSHLRSSIRANRGWARRRSGELLFGPQSFEGVEATLRE